MTHSVPSRDEVCHDRSQHLTQHALHAECLRANRRGAALHALFRMKGTAVVVAIASSASRILHLILERDARQVQGRSISDSFTRFQLRLHEQEGGRERERENCMERRP